MNQSEGDADAVTEDGREYLRLRIEGMTPSSEIWIGDDHGHPVVRGTGSLDVHLLPGFYTVQFSLGGATYPLALEAPIRSTEAAICAGPTCPKPEFRFYDHPDALDEAPRA